MAIEILLVEDDPESAEWVTDVIEDRFDHVKVCWLQTELEVERFLREGSAGRGRSRPSIVVLDVMLPWRRPSEEPEPRPAGVKEGGSGSRPA